MGSCLRILSVPRPTVSFKEQIMSKDNYPCIFPKPKVVYCLYHPSNISSHSESSGAKTKHEAKHVDFLVLAYTAFSTSFLISTSGN